MTDAQVETEARSVTPWTPGPWEARDAEDGDWEVVKYDPSDDFRDDPWYIATIHDDADGGDTRANAHLIAAAPALYEAAAWALEVASTGSWTYEGMKRLRAALSLARGEQV